MSKKMTFGSQRVLLPLIAFGVCLLILAFSASARPAYAGDSSPPPPGASPQTRTDPGGGGGPPPSNKIDGYVFNPKTGHAVPNMKVYAALDTSEDCPTYTYTDSNGHFLINWLTILPNRIYYVTVNGGYQLDGSDTLGSVCDDSSYGQWREKDISDINGYISCAIDLEPRQVVIVPYAALYSNTQYCQLMTYTSTSYHDLSFSASVGSTGFESTQAMTVSFSWGVKQRNDSYIGKHYYAVGYWDQEPNGGLKNTGINGEVDPNEGWRQFNISEYLVPDSNKPNYGLPSGSQAKWYGIYGNSPVSFHYSETSSFTWSYGFSGSLGINFDFFGVSVNLDVTATVTSGHTNEVDFSILLPDGAPTHKFLVYTQGFTFIENVTGGLEVHLWDLGVIS